MHGEKNGDADADGCDGGGGGGAVVCGHPLALPLPIELWVGVVLKFTCWKDWSSSSPSSSSE